MHAGVTRDEGKRNRLDEAPYIDCIRGIGSWLGHAGSFRFSLVFKQKRIAGTDQRAEGSRYRSGEGSAAARGRLGKHDRPRTGRQPVGLGRVPKR